MCTDGEAFLRYAKAERELCEMAGPVLTRIIDELESRHGIRIAELRVTMDRSHSLNGWPAANCVMVREDEVEAEHSVKKLRSSPGRRYTATNKSQEAKSHVCSRYRMMRAPGSESRSAT
jgi:hypothetical protein